MMFVFNWIFVVCVVVGILGSLLFCRGLWGDLTNDEKCSVGFASGVIAWLLVFAMPLGACVGVGTYSSREWEFDRGIRAVRQGRIEDARWHFERVAKAGHEESQFELGELLREQGKIDEAIVWYKKAASRGYVKAQERLVELFEKEGNAKEVLRWRKAVEYNKKHRGVKRR